jgi:hypothetical protein
VSRELADKVCKLTDFTYLPSITMQLLFCLRNGLWYGESLADWDSVKAKGLNHAKFVNMIEQVDFESTVTDSVVVSTIEKVHRVHSTDDI